MSAQSFAAYVLALLIAIASPGPAMIAVIAAAARGGSRAGVVTGLGVAFADVLLVAAALAGLAALMVTFEPALLIVKWVGGAYLIWIGIKMWRTPVYRGAEDARPPQRTLATGFAVGLSNPKAVLFHASLMPLVIDLAAIDIASAGLIIATVFLVNCAVMSAFAVAAGGGAARLRSPRGQRLLNRSAGGAMVGAGAIVIAR